MGGSLSDPIIANNAEFEHILRRPTGHTPVEKTRYDYTDTKAQEHIGGAHVGTAPPRVVSVV